MTATKCPPHLVITIPLRTEACDQIFEQVSVTDGAALLCCSSRCCQYRSKSLLKSTEDQRKKKGVGINFHMCLVKCLLFV